MFLATLSGGVRAEDCIDYRDYIHWVAQLIMPDQAKEIVVADDYAYVVDGYSLQVVDVSNSARPEIVGSVGMPGSALGVAVADDHAYVADGNHGLQIVDISNPSAPAVVGNVGTAGWGPAGGVAVAGNYAFVTTDIGLEVMDVSDPGAASLVGRVEIMGVPLAVAVVGTRACVAEDYWDTLVVVDVSEPNAPVVAGSAELPGHAGDVAVEGDCAYVAARNAGLQIVDISNPTSPVIIGSTEMPDARGVAVAGDHAYVTDGQLHVVDISMPNSPAVLGAIGASQAVHTVAVTGSHAYVGDWDGGLHLADISTPAFPEMVGSVEIGPAVAVAVANSYAYVTTGACRGGRGGTICWGSLDVLDISNPSSPASTGSVGFPLPAGGVDVAGDYAYVAAGGCCLQVVDTSNRALPEVVGSVGTPSGSQDVAVAGAYAYVAGDFGLLTVDVTIPPVPAIVGTLETPGEAHAVAISGDRACVAGSFGLLVVDISDPTSPEILGSIVMPSASVSVVGHYAYVAGGNSGLLVVDISDPALPEIAGSIGMLGYAAVVSVAGDYAYVACGVAGLQVVHISNPSSPALVGGLFLAPAQDVVAAGDHVLVASRIGDSSGRLAVCFPQCEFPTPVNLASCDITEADGVVRIMWETSFEEEHLGFHVERAVEDRDRFERVTVELIRAAGDRGRLYEFVDRTVTPGETYTYRLTAIDLRGGTQRFSIGSVTVGRVLPATMVLHQNRPNPFNPSTSIAFELPVPKHVALRIYDAGGRLVRTLVDDDLEQGPHGFEWNGLDHRGRELGPGVYFYRLNAGDRTLTRKLVMRR